MVEGVAERMVNEIITSKQSIEPLGSFLLWNHENRSKGTSKPIAEGVSKNLGNRETSKRVSDGLKVLLNEYSNSLTVKRRNRKWTVEGVMDHGSKIADGWGCCWMDDAWREWVRL